MAQAAEQLVGRPAELDAIDQMLAGLEHGGPAAVALVGEPGIGKTRLLAELAARADARGQLVLSGSASELERDLPFWVFVDALDEYAEGLDPRRLEQLDESARAELGHVLPALSGLGSGGDTALQDERYRTHRAFRDLLEVLAASKPLVLILDDLHWADSGTVELLGALMRRLPAAPVLLAMAMRPRQTPDRLAAAFERAHRTGRLIRLELGALSLPETRQLLGSGVDGAAAAALHEESGGNPFYVEQLARSLERVPGRAAAASDLALAVGEVPPAVAAALTEELGLLSPAVRLVLEGAAVAGDPFEPELMAAAAGVSESDAVAALDVLLRSDLVRHTDVPRRFRFRHPLVRRAIYDASPGGWRLGAHQRSAEALAERGAPATALVHHVERSARHGDSAAVAVLREAGTAAAQRTPATAARWFEAALRILSNAAPPADRVELLTALAGAQAATGQFAEARAAMLEAMELLPGDATSLRMQLTAGCAGLEQLLGRHDEAHRRLVHALEGLADPASPEAAAVMITLAMDAFYRQARADTRDWGTRALAVARPLGDEQLIAAASAVLALACAFEGALEDAELHRSEAAALIDAMPDDRLAVRLDAIAYLCGAESYMDRFGESCDTRPARSGRRACNRAGVPLADARAGHGLGAGRAGPAQGSGRVAGRGGRGLAPRRQRSDARVGPPEPRFRLRAPGRDGPRDCGCGGEPGSDPRSPRQLRRDARRRDARHRAHGARGAGAGRRAVRRLGRWRGNAVASGRVAGEIPAAADAGLADARATSRGGACGGVRRCSRRSDGPGHGVGVGAARRSGRGTRLGRCRGRCRASAGTRPSRATRPVPFSKLRCRGCWRAVRWPRQAIAIAP